MVSSHFSITFHKLCASQPSLPSSAISIPDDVTNFFVLITNFIALSPRPPLPIFHPATVWAQLQPFPPFPGMEINASIHLSSFPPPPQTSPPRRGAGIVPKIKIFVFCHCAKNVYCHSAKSILVFKLSVCQKYFQLVCLPKQILNLVTLPKNVVGNLPKRCENESAMLCQ